MADTSDSAGVAFLALLLADRAGGRERSLAEYARLFPGCEDEVARRWLEVRVGPEDTEEGGPAESGLRRLGRYELERELGRGGQGAVFLARDVELGRPVALKVVPRVGAAADLAPRFRREARALSRLDRDDVCAIHDVGHDDDVAWIAMRFVEGRTLAAEIEAWRAAGEPPDVDRVTELVERAARALQAAHEAGLVHRDVKPQNVMVTPDGSPVLLDFGIARPADGGAPLTLTGEALGTPAYLAPEALAGSGAVDARADVWALGVTLHETLTLARPFEAPTREALVRQVLEREPPSVRGLRRDVSRDLAVVVATALAKDPAHRYATAADFAEDLRRARAGEPIRARPTPAAAVAWRWARRRPALAGSLAALLLVLAGGLLVTGLLLGRTRALLGDFTRVADRRIVRELQAEATELWPAVPERADAMRDWLARVDAALGRRADHRAALDAIGGADAHDARALPETTNAWMQEQLVALLDELDALDATRARVAERRAFALDVERRTLEEPAERWARAAARVAADPRFAGLALAPQRGLVPLGPDRETGLEEFALVATGTAPGRDASGALELEPASGLVFVLVPGGDTRVGADAPSAGRPAGSPHVDPGRRDGDGPSQAVSLDPFLISKYEMTQGQWTRHTGENPSYFPAYSRFVDETVADLHPVEQVTLLDAVEVLAQLELEPPTEAQWEYAARAGSTTVWYTGDDPRSLDGHANLADAWARTHGGGGDWSYEDWLDDGFTAHSPVGTFAANRFGLHDVCGNVLEWCRDSWEDLNAVEPRPGDGLRVGEEGLYCVRGGAFTAGAWDARSAYRDGYPPYFNAPYAGLRPARRLR